VKLEEIKIIEQQALSELAEAVNAETIEALRIKYLSRKGIIPLLMQELKSVSKEDKPAFGQAVNKLKQSLQLSLDEKNSTFKTDAAPVAAFDMTLPGNWHKTGSHHPITLLIDRVSDIFSGIGFTVAEGPDIETEYYNFDALNTPEDHPARNAQDTFYFGNGNLLRTQTSPVQIRYMEKNQPPIRIISPGRVYRRDTPDATHTANFHQVEGLYVGKNVSMADLKGDLLYFAKQILGEDVQIRFRPHFFPFTEPSFEVDFYCDLGKTKGWLEIAGAGMVDPDVLKAVGYDPSEVSGYAFGMGIERIAMILHEIDDIRLIYDNDIRFLSQI